MGVSLKSGFWEPRHVTYAAITHRPQTQYVRISRLRIYVYPRVQMCRTTKKGTKSAPRLCLEVLAIQQIKRYKSAPRTCGLKCSPSNRSSGVWSNRRCYDASCASDMHAWYALFMTYFGIPSVVSARESLFHDLYFWLRYKKIFSYTGANTI